MGYSNTFHELKKLNQLSKGAGGDSKARTGVSSLRWIRLEAIAMNAIIGRKKGTSKAMSPDRSVLVPMEFHSRLHESHCFNRTLHVPGSKIERWLMTRACKRFRWMLSAYIVSTLFNNPSRLDVNILELNDPPSCESIKPSCSRHDASLTRRHAGTSTRSDSGDWEQRASLRTEQEAIPG